MKMRVRIGAAVMAALLYAAGSAVAYEDFTQQRRQWQEQEYRNQPKWEQENRQRAQESDAWVQRLQEQNRLDEIERRIRELELDRRYED